MSLFFGPPISGSVYRFTRNPMYLGLMLTLLAWAVFLSSPLAVLFVPLFVLYINRYQIGPEERRWMPLMSNVGGPRTNNA